MNKEKGVSLIEVLLSISIALSVFSSLMKLEVHLLQQQSVIFQETKKLMKLFNEQQSNQSISH